MTQPLDAGFQQQLVLVDKGGMRLAQGLVAGERHPVKRIVCKQLVPRVESLLVNESRFEINQLYGRGRAHAPMPSPRVIRSAQARYCPRMGASLVAPKVPVIPALSAGVKLRCR